MKITIKGFRKYIDRTFFIADNEMTLISGRSGSGKSTILNAIYWCLFGSLTNIYNNCSSNRKISVTLEFNDIIIERLSGKGKLKMTTKNDGRTYQGAVAEKMVVNYFGEKRTWLASSYIKQGELCLLLSGSNNEKMELLNILSFQNENPGDYIQRIDSEINSFSKVVTNLENDYRVQVGIYSQKLKERSFDSKLNLTSETIKKFELELSQKKQMSTTLVYQVQEQYQLKGQVQILNENLAHLIGQLNALPSFSTKKRSTLSSTLSSNTSKILQNTNQISIINSNQKKIQSINQAQISMNSIGNQIDISWHSIKNKEELIGVHMKNNSESGIKTVMKPWEILLGKYTNEDLARITIQTQLYSNEQLICSQERVEYNSSVINTRIKKLAEQVQLIQSYNAMFPTYQQIESLKKRIRNLPDENYDPEREKELRNSFIQGQNAQDILKCPACDVSLRYHQKSLKLAEKEPVSLTELMKIKTKIDELMMKRQRIEMKKGIRTRLDALIKSIGGDEGIKKFENISSLVVGHKGNLQSSSLNNSLIRLKNIKIIGRTIISPSLIKLLFSYQRAKTKYLSEKLSCKGGTLISSINPSQLIKDINVLQVENTQIKDTIQVIDRTANSTDLIQQNIDRIRIQLNKIVLTNQPETTLNTLKSMIETLGKRIDNARYSNKMVNEQQILISKRQKVIDKQKKLHDLSRLKELAIKVECQQLQATVDSINATLTAIVDVIFEEPITIQLRLFKQLKSSKRVKPQVNISIKYRGAEYNKINDLSGGEASRVSLAFVIALSSVSSSRFLLLDEVMSTLDDELREKCLDSIRTLLAGSKTIISINHKDNSGDYDRVIVLDGDFSIINPQIKS